MHDLTGPGQVEERQHGRKDGLREVVHEGERKRPPSESAVPDVQRVERRLRHALEPGGADCNDEAERHPAPGKHARDEEELVSPPATVVGGRHEPEAEKPEHDGKDCEPVCNSAHVLSRLCVRES